MLARMDSQELTGFLALFKVHEQERDAAEEEAKHQRESDDGHVIAFGKPRGLFDDEEDEDDTSNGGAGASDRGKDPGLA